MSAFHTIEPESDGLFGSGSMHRFGSSLGALGPSSCLYASHPLDALRLGDPLAWSVSDGGSSTQCWVTIAVGAPGDGTVGLNGSDVGKSELSAGSVRLIDVTSGDQSKERMLIGSMTSGLNLTLVDGGRFGLSVAVVAPGLQYGDPSVVAVMGASPSGSNVVEHGPGMSDAEPGLDGSDF